MKNHLCSDGIMKCANILCPNRLEPTQKLRTAQATGFNQPYRGALVPIEFYIKNPLVLSIMIEVNRKLYMGELNGTKMKSFKFIQKDIRTLLNLIAGFQIGASVDEVESHF